MTPREIARSGDVKAMNPVPGVDYGRKLADEIARLRLEEPDVLAQMLLVAQANAGMAYYTAVLCKAGEILPPGVSVDDVSDGTTIAALFDAVNATPLGEPLTRHAQQVGQAFEAQSKE